MFCARGSHLDDDAIKHFTTAPACSVTSLNVELRTDFIRLLMSCAKQKIKTTLGRDGFGQEQFRMSKMTWNILNYSEPSKLPEIP